MQAEKVPALIDLQVLSPLAWIRRTSIDLKRSQGDPNYEPHDYRGALLDRAVVIAKMTVNVPRPQGEESRRQLEWHLIQSAALAVTWLEDLRSYETQGVNKDGSGT